MNYLKNAIEKYERYSSMARFELFFLKNFKSFIRKMKIENITALYAPQWEIAEHIIHSVIFRDMEQIYVEFSRQSGKTYTMAWIVSYLSYYLPIYADESQVYDNEVSTMLVYFCGGIRTGIFAPGLKQSNFAYIRIRAIVHRMIDKYKIDMKVDRQDYIEFPSGSKVSIFTASPGSHIEGATLDFIYIDEAQDVEDIMLKKSIFPMGTHTMATSVLVGTPTMTLDKKRYFYDKITEGTNCYIYDWNEIAKYSDAYATYVQGQIELYGKDDIGFQCSYLLRWPIESLSFTDYSQLKRNGRADIRRIKTALVNNFKETLDNIYVGIDVAKSPDSTVCTVIQLVKIMDDDPDYNEERPYKMIILDWLELMGDTYDKQIEIVYEFLCRYAIRRISVDAVGVGDVFVDMLERKFVVGNFLHHRHTKIKSLKWTQYNHHDIFRRLHNEWWEGRILYPDDGSMESIKFKYQFSRLGYEYQRGLLKCHHPTGEHDDYCSSLGNCIDAIGLDYFMPHKVISEISKEVAKFSGSSNIPSIRGFSGGTQRSDVWVM